MRFANSALALLWSVAGSFFHRPRGVQAQVATDLGAGNCVDCNGTPREFDSLAFTGLATQADCENKCTGCDTALVSPSQDYDLVGYEYDGSSECHCLFASNIAGADLSATACSGNTPDDTNSGTGEICGVSSTGTVVGNCYTLVDAVPSSQPSSQPSSNPSETPSSNPSTMPSSNPSSMPSESPSDNPSSEPSGQPSLSRPPSDSPSVTPSQTPSDVPSTEPSSEPSSTPSCSPSASPTTNPSNEYGVNLWYPKWMHGDEGCRNDGEEPNYMASNPNYWLSSTLENCCKQWFGGYAYNNCMGNYPPGDCTVKLYYPDWQGSNTGCLNDGQEPYYMLGNADHFLSNTLQECCDKFYLWNLYTCTGTTPTLSNGDYYPDWLSASAMTCKNDGQFPEYMLADQGHYLSTTLEKCCDKFYHWDVNACLGTSAVGSTDWYVQWTSYSCKQDCEVGSATACGGLAEFWDETFSTLDQCCKAKLPWMSLQQCREDSQS